MHLKPLNIIQSYTDYSNIDFSPDSKSNDLDLEIIDLDLSDADDNTTVLD